MPHYLRPLNHLALASASPRRRELLTSLGLDITIVKSTYEELPLAEHSPRELAIAHARGKAQGAPALPMLIVGADTVVDLDGEALGKPRDRAESQSMIERLSGREHQVHTAFALRDDQSGQTVTECRTTRVWFAPLHSDIVAAYVAGGDGLDKAGAYGIQGFGATLVERIDGDYFTVVGFPLAAFAETVRRLGYALLPPRALDATSTARRPEVPA